MISIVIPVYNAESLLNLTLDTLLNQVDNECEIILVNDGSTDNSAVICETYADAYNNITVIHQNNFGPSVARNNGLKLAKGEYITFLDSDDHVNPNWYSIISTTIKNNAPDLIITGFQMSIKREKKIKFMKSNKPYPRIVEGNVNIIKLIPELIDELVFNPLWNKVYKKKIINYYNIRMDPKVKLGEDFLFNLNYFKFINTLVVDENETYNYLITDDGLTRRYIDDKFNKLLPVTIEFKKFLEEHKFSYEGYHKRLLRNVYNSTMELSRKRSNISKTDQHSSVDQMLKNPYVEEFLKDYRPKSIKSKLLINILRTKNTRLILFASNMLYIVRNKC